METGVYFEKGYESEGLPHILELVIAHQKRNLLLLETSGITPDPTPTRKESVAAATSISGAFDHASIRRPDLGLNAQLQRAHFIPFLFAEECARFCEKELFTRRRQAPISMRIGTG